MRATVMYGAGDVRVENVPDARLIEPTDALVRVTRAAICGGPAPVRAYIEELLPDVLEGRIEPGRVFDGSGSIEDVPDGYAAMNDREVLKFQIRP
jgi:threonine dehydrogenase-like Zn-dependent dehydrogenase